MLEYLSLVTLVLQPHYYMYSLRLDWLDVIPFHIISYPTSLPHAMQDHTLLSPLRIALI